LSYLLDTNVISELARAKPAQRVLAWFEAVPSEALHVSVLTLGEIRKGVESVSDARRRERLQVWLENDLRDWFGERVLAIDAPVAHRWGRLLAAAGRSLPTIDSLLAATALQRGLRLVTRNVGDFAYAGLAVVNPWDA
jgi:toxin FitB